MIWSARKLSYVLMSSGLLVFALISADVACHGYLREFDLTVAHLFKTHRSVPLIWCFSAAPALGEVWILAPIVLGVTIIQIMRKNWRNLFLFLLAMVVAGVVITPIKILFAIPRPKETSYYYLHEGFSYPSGHTFGSMTLLGISVILLWSHVVMQKYRGWMLTLFITTVLAVAWGLVYTGTHWVTDVLAALGLCTAWLGFCLRLSLPHDKTTTEQAGTEPRSDTK